MARAFKPWISSLRHEDVAYFKSAEECRPCLEETGQRRKRQERGGCKSASDMNRQDLSTTLHGAGRTVSYEMM
jgi:hypothetical protein